MFSDYINDYINDYVDDYIDYKLSWNKLTCYCCCLSSSWLDLGTQECNGSSLSASAPLSQFSPQVSPQLPRFHVFRTTRSPYAEMGKTYRHFYNKVSI